MEDSNDDSSWSSETGRSFVRPVAIGGGADITDGAENDVPEPKRTFGSMKLLTRRM
jgi:hypothetical protein